MNRKAKFAYILMLIGLFVFMVSFLLILNHFLNGDFTRSSHVNLKDKNITLYINTNKPDPNLYLKLYCSFKDYISDSELNEDTAHLNIIQSKCFKVFFGFLLCSSDKVYFVVIILICVLGFCLLTNGCINFYKYDISLLAIPRSSSTMSEINQKMKHSDSDLCCIRSRLASSNLLSERKCPFAYEELPTFMVTNDYSQIVGSRLGSYRSTDSRLTPNSPFLLDKSYGTCTSSDINQSEPKTKSVNFKFERPHRYRGLSSGSSLKFVGCDEIFL